MYEYWRSEPGLWTVGTIDNEGHKHAESDHETTEAAAKRVSFLNGGSVTPEVKVTSPTNEVKHYQVNGRYKVQFERSAVKGQDGFKVEANGDDFKQTFDEAGELYNHAVNATQINITTSPAPAIK